MWKWESNPSIELLASNSPPDLKGIKGADGKQISWAKAIPGFLLCYLLSAARHYDVQKHILVISMLMLKPNCKMRKILLHSWNHQPPTIASIKMFQEVTIDPHRHPEITFLPKVLTKIPWCVLGVPRFGDHEFDLSLHVWPHSAGWVPHIGICGSLCGPPVRNTSNNGKDLGTAGNDVFFPWESWLAKSVAKTFTIFNITWISIVNGVSRRSIYTYICIYVSMFW